MNEFETDICSALEVRGLKLARSASTSVYVILIHFSANCAHPGTKRITIGNSVIGAWTGSAEHTLSARPATVGAGLLPVSALNEFRVARIAEGSGRFFLIADSSRRERETTPEIVGGSYAKASERNVIVIHGSTPTLYRTALPWKASL
jgi:hypothetical protein